MDYGALAANATGLEAFKEDLRRAFLAGVARGWSLWLADPAGALPLRRAAVTRVAEGSVRAEVQLRLPEGTTPGEAAELRSLVTSGPAALLAGWALAPKAVAAEAGGLGGAARAAPAEAGRAVPLNPMPMVVGIVIAIVIGVAVLAGVSALIIVRKQRSGSVVSGGGARAPAGGVRQQASIGGDE